MRMQFTRSFILPIAVAAATVLGPMVARAVDTAPPTQQQQQQPQQQAFSEDQLKAYAVAALQVSAIQQEYASKIVAAQQTQPQPQTIQSLNDEAEGKMADAVRKRGLSVETYNNITRAARAEPAVRQRIIQFMGKAPAKTPQPQQPQ